MLREAYDHHLIPMAEKWVREHCLRQAREAVIARAAAKMKELLTAGPYNFESPRLVSAVIGDESVRHVTCSGFASVSCSWSDDRSVAWVDGGCCADPELFGGAEPRG